MRALLAIIFLLTAQPVFAGEYQDNHGQWWKTIDPDESWFSKPLLWKPRVRYLPEAHVYRVCEMATKLAKQAGCAIPLGTFIDIFIIKELPKTYRDNVLRHEMAHAHGWGADHSLAPAPKLQERADSLPDWPDKPKRDAAWFNSRWAD